MPLVFFQVLQNKAACILKLQHTSLSDGIFCKIVSR